jgi:hypothetical protein
MPALLKKLTLAALYLSLSGALCAEDFYLSPSGSDSNPGSLEQPLQSLEEAQIRVRASAQRGKQAITVHLREGTYYLSDTLVFDPADSGSADAPVTYAAYQDEEVILSGGTKLQPNWQPYRDGIFKAKLSGEDELDQLFVNGTRQHMARYPNFDASAKALAYNGHSADAFAPERAQRWSDPTGGYIHAMHKHRWGGYHYRITGKDDEHQVSYEGGWQNNRQMGMHPDQRMVENIFEELDAPGEWFFDRDSRTLYFYPPEGVDLDRASVETARLSELIELRGSQADPVRHLNFEGLTFRHTARTFMQTKEPLLRSDWAIYRGGAFFVNGAEDCMILNCTFDQTGGNSIFVNNYNRRIHIRGAHIYGSGASAVAFVGSPDAVRNPLFEYKQTQAYADIDLTPGPKTNNYPADCVVEDSLIHKVGVLEKQAAGVQISMASRITVRHCSIYDTSRAGINVSEGTFGGHRIEYCDVFDTVLETHDHGSFNSWGRDRFWHLKGAPADKLAELALLDAVETTVIRNSRWRCDHGWDIDLDDGSSNYEITNNLMLRRGLKLREGFHRTVTNNIAINNTMHAHVWYPDSNTKVTGNIWMRAYRPARMRTAEQFSAQVDHNFFTSEADRDKFADKDWDLNSLVGDPQFVDHAKGDFRLKANSPALEIGFKNFPMDQFGVQRAELKAIARTPEFVAPVVPNAQATQTIKTALWFGAKATPLKGEEFSAFGVSQEIGGIHLLSVPHDSLAATYGLKAGDVVQAINEKPTPTLRELRQVTRNTSGQSFSIAYVREQQTRTLDIQPTR